MKVQVKRLFGHFILNIIYQQQIQINLHFFYKL